MNMDWTNIILALIGAVLGSGGSILYLRPKLRKENVDADKSLTNYLEQRIDSMGKLYEEQGKALDQVRHDMLTLSQQMAEREQKIIELQTENRVLSDKVNKLESELKTYKSRKR